jgi:hypothetical protein
MADISSQEAARASVVSRHGSLNAARSVSYKIVP